MSVHVYVSLGDLAPDDVDVQVVHGRVRHEDDLLDPVVVPVKHAETYEGGRHRYEGIVSLSTTGPFGYTVRVVPSHAGLASVAELALVTAPVG
jgi:starch phosphorylase